MTAPTSTPPTDTARGRLVGIVRAECLCPGCSWKGRARLVGTRGWLERLQADLDEHPCQEGPTTP